MYSLFFLLTFLACAFSSEHHPKIPVVFPIDLNDLGYRFDGARATLPPPPRHVGGIVFPIDIRTSWPGLGSEAPLNSVISKKRQHPDEEFCPYPESTEDGAGFQEAEDPELSAFCADVWAEFSDKDFDDLPSGEGPGLSFPHYEDDVISGGGGALGAGLCAAFGDDADSGAGLYAAFGDDADSGAGLYAAFGDDADSGAGLYAAFGADADSGAGAGAGAGDEDTGAGEGGGSSGGSSSSEASDSSSKDPLSYENPLPRDHRFNCLMQKLTLENFTLCHDRMIKQRRKLKELASQYWRESNDTLATLAEKNNPCLGMFTGKVDTLSFIAAMKSILVEKREKDLLKKYEELFKKSLEAKMAEEPIGRISDILQYFLENDKTTFEVWIAAVEDSYSHKPIMMMSVVSHPECCATHHIGIFKTSYGLNMSKDRYPTHLSMDLHAYAAQIMLKRNRERIYMMTTPLPNMGVIFEKAVPDFLYTWSNSVCDDEHAKDKRVGLELVKSTAFNSNKKGRLSQKKVFKFRLPGELDKYFVVDPTSTPYKWMSILDCVFGEEASVLIDLVGLANYRKVSAS
jgi:hypothetical protein